MQASSLQVDTWATVVLEALKILGPAALTLLGSLVALRHQRLTRNKELDAGARMKARELVFNHYQKKLDKISAMSDSLGKSFGEIQVEISLPEASEGNSAIANFVASLISITLVVMHEVEDAEDELKAFGMERKYERELAVLNQLANNSWQVQGTLEQQFGTLREMLFSLVSIQEALLEARMKELFHDYLPSRSVRNISIVKG
jgi:hypothetical protein